MRILVCMKQVLDPEAPAELLKIDPGSLRVSAAGTPEVLNPYDTNALAAALGLKSEAAELGDEAVEIVVLTVTPRPSKPLMLKALAAGADGVIALRVPEQTAGWVDSTSTAARLGALVREAGDFDLILAGREAADTNAGVASPLLAGLLGIPLVAFAVGIRVSPGGTVAVDRLTDDGVLTERVALPALVTVSSEIGDLEPVDFRGISAAKRKPIRVVEGADVEPAGGPYLVALDRPRIERHCEMIEAETGRLAGTLLAKRLR